MPSGKYTDHMPVRRIAEQTGLTISSVYKILNGSSGFSAGTRQRVEALAAQLQLRPLRPPDSRDLTLGVLLPEHPAYFWNEAIRGIKSTAQALQERLGIRIKPIFRFLHFPLDGTEIETALCGFAEADCRAYIVYPIDHPAFRDFMDTLPPELPVMLFNDLPEDVSFSQRLLERPMTAYVGADHEKEGADAARILGERLGGMHRVLALLSEDSRMATAARLRIDGFTRVVRELQPSIRVEVQSLAADGKLTPGFLAARIESDILNGKLDCLYVSSGVTHVASAAIAKVRRRNCLPLAACPLCLGHECSPSDRPYLLDGTQCGYVKQDVYTQARIAVEQVVTALSDGTPPTDGCVRSSVFVNGGAE